MLSPGEEHDLIDAAQRNPLAFRPIFLRYFGPVFRYFALRGATAAEAERLAVDVFAEALSTLSTLASEERGILPWLLDIGSHHAATRQGRRPSIREQSNADGVAESTAGELHRLLGHVDAATAEALVLLLFAGLSAEETAKAMNTSPIAVKMSLYRAVSKAERRQWACDEGG